MPRLAERLRQDAEQIATDRIRKKPHKLYYENPEKAATLKIHPFLFAADQEAARFTGQGIQFNRWNGKIIIPSRREGMSSMADSKKPIYTDPRGVGIQSLRLAEVNTIEEAMRETIHTSHRYRPDGQTKTNIDTFMGYVSALEQGIVKGEITKENLPDVLNYTLALFESIQFGRPTKDSKKLARKKTLNALSLDNLGRFNKSRSESMLISAFIIGFQEFLASEKILYKYDRYFDALAAERLHERMAIQIVMRRVDEIFKHTGNNEVLKALVFDLEDSVRTFFNVDSIKVAPYRIPALTFAFGVFGIETNIVGLDRTADPEEYIQNMLTPIGHNANQFIREIIKNGSIKSIFDIRTLNATKQKKAIEERLQKYLEPVWDVYDQAADWRNAKVRIESPELTKDSSV